MRFHRLPVKDPRTVARDIPGICDLLFPELVPAIIAHLNRGASAIPACTAITLSQINNSSISAAMLFEVAYVKAEGILKGSNLDWENCIKIAVDRQSRYFDTNTPEYLNEIDISIANQTAENLVKALNHIRHNNIQTRDKLKNDTLIISPIIQGYHWISQGVGDFAFDKCLIEVKCTGKNFSSTDYRQLLMYWLLSYSAAIENKGVEWEKGILLNPRQNRYVEFKFSEIVNISSGGRSKVEVLELFSSIINDWREIV